MAIAQLHQGITQEKTQNGTVTNITYYGAKSDIDTQFGLINVTPTTTSGYGRLESVSKQQIAANLWSLTYKYNTAGYTSGSATPSTPPSTEVGVKSYSLDCSMISSPLEQHPSYLKKWNYGLARKYLIANKPATLPSTPAWYDTATATSVIPIADQGDYQWFQSTSELPLESGYVWVELAQPTMAGYTSYDEVGYTLTMAVRQKTYAAAETFAANKANKIFTNAQVGSSFTSGNWKCDRATVNWDGEFWIVNLTFTYSARNWNTTLYPDNFTGSIS